MKTQNHIKIVVFGWNYYITKLNNSQIEKVHQGILLLFNIHQSFLPLLDEWDQLIARSSQNFQHIFYSRTTSEENYKITFFIPMWTNNIRYTEIAFSYKILSSVGILINTVFSWISIFCTDLISSTLYRGIGYNRTLL